MLLQCTLTDALLSLSLESELMMAHWLECCLAVNLWFMICFQGLYGIGIHKSRNGLGPAYLTYRLSPEATVSQLQSAEWLIWSSLGSFSGRSPSARVRQPQLSFWNIVLTFRKKMVKSSVAWRRYAGIAEFFHANGVFFFFWLNGFPGCFIYLLSSSPLPSPPPFLRLILGAAGELKCACTALGASHVHRTANSSQTCSGALFGPQSVSFGKLEPESRSLCDKQRAYSPTSESIYLSHKGDTRIN